MISCEAAEEQVQDESRQQRQDAQAAAVLEAADNAIKARQMEREEEATLVAKA